MARKNPGNTANPEVTDEGRPCNTCTVWKPWEQFGLRKGGRNGRTATCRDCYTAGRPDRSEERRKARARYRGTPALRAADRDKHLRRNYGISSDEYDAMHAEQGGACFLCMRVPEQRLPVDHDHVTGKVRRLLCYSCNVALGLVDDDVDLLKRMIEYVEEFR